MMDLYWPLANPALGGELSFMLAWRPLVTLLTFLAVYSLAQQTPSPQEDHGRHGKGDAVRLIPRSEAERQHTSQASHHIILNVVVTDASGHPVPGLSASDFTILDAGLPQAITSFRTLDHDDAQPVHAILVLDAENNSSHEYGSERKAVEKFLTESHGSLPLPVAIARLSDSGFQIQHASRDANVLLPEVHSLSGEVHDSGSTDATFNREMETGVRTPDSMPSLAPMEVRLQLHQQDQNQRFVLSISQLEKLAVRQQDVPGRAIVVWMGPGWPLLNGPGFLPDTPEIQRRFFDHIVGVSTEIREAQMTLDLVASPDAVFSAKLTKPSYEPLLTAVTAPAEAGAGDLGLPILALQSGGQVLDQNKDLAAGIAQCLAHATSGYQLSFESRPSSHPDEYRPLQVKIDRPGVTARTNAGYYAEP